MLEIVKAFRRCARCGCWRSIGNFTYSRDRGRISLKRMCRRCIGDGTPRLRGARFWVLTDKGRRALRELEVA